MVATAPKSGEAFIRELTQIRQEFQPSAPPSRGTPTREAGTAKMRRALRGGFYNHTFIGEQYLNCPDKTVRRKQLQKVMDEGGQIHFGGPVVSHITLAKWEGNAYGVTDDEIERLSLEDIDAEMLVYQGWRTAVCRHEHFTTAIGTSYVGEGGTYLRVVKEPEQVAKEMDELRERFVSWGVEDLDKAMANALEHNVADEDHGQFSETVLREDCNTPELQDRFRFNYLLRWHSFKNLF